MKSAATGRRARGFSLIEVMVTIVVVSVGLLGFVALLNRSIVANRQAYMRSQATIMAHDVAERMRVNRAAAVGGAYNLTVGSAPVGGSVAGNDLVDWTQHLARELPAGQAGVAVDASGNVTITIRWDDDNDGTATTFVTQTAI